MHDVFDLIAVIHLIVAPKNKGSPIVTVRRESSRSITYTVLSYKQFLETLANLFSKKSISLTITDFANAKCLLFIYLYF